jgi:hypothetical protein
VAKAESGGGRPCLYFSPDGLHGRLMVAGRRPRTVRNFVSRPKFRLAPVTQKNKNKFGPLAFALLFCSAGETPRQWWTTTHGVLARRRNFPARDGEKLTTGASVSNRPRRCKNGNRHVARSLLAPNPGVVSKIGGKTVIPFVPGNVGWPPGGQRSRGIGAPTPVAPGPSERPRGDDGPRRLPPALRARPCHTPSRAKAQTAASPLIPHVFDSVFAPRVLGSNLRTPLPAAFDLGFISPLLERRIAMTNNV